MKTTDQLSPYNRFLHEGATVIALEMNLLGEILSWNKYAEEMIGIDKLINVPVFRDVVVNFENIPDLNQILDEGDKTWIFNIESSDQIPATFHFTFYRQTDGAIAFGQVDHEEIGKLKKSLIESNQEINNLARELHKKNAQLSKLNELKNQFLGMAAHDMRSPISHILQYSQFLGDEITDNNHLELISRIHRSSKFMLTLLNELLDISKIEAGKLELSLSDTDMGELINTSVVYNRVLSEKKSITIVYAPTHELPMISIDAGKIEQVMNNLLTNAIKYSYQDSEIKVSASFQDDYIQVEVQDQGQGIPEAEQSKIFEGFQKTSVKSTAGEKSTGLGLLIAKKIVEGHGGKIWLTSKVGLGSSFCFTLPVSSEHKVDSSPKGVHQYLAPENKEQEEKKPESRYYNQDAIHSLQLIGSDFFMELIDTFLKQTEKQIEDIGVYLKEANLNTIVEITQTMKGAACKLGVEPLSEICQKIIAAKHKDEVSEQLDSLRNVFEKTRECLSDLVSNMKQ